MKSALAVSALSLASLVAPLSEATAQKRFSQEKQIRRSDLAGKQIRRGDDGLELDLQGAPLAQIRVATLSIVERRGTSTTYRLRAEGSNAQYLLYVSTEPVLFTRIRPLSRVGSSLLGKVLQAWIDDQGRAQRFFNVLELRNLVRLTSGAWLIAHPETEARLVATAAPNCPRQYSRTSGGGLAEITCRDDQWHYLRARLIRGGSGGNGHWYYLLRHDREFRGAVFAALPESVAESFMDQLLARGCLYMDDQWLTDIPEIEPNARLLYMRSSPPRWI